MDLTIILFLLFTVNFANTCSTIRKKSSCISNIFSVLVKKPDSYRKTQNHNRMNRTIYNYGPLCRETSRFVNLKEKLFSPRTCPRENNTPRVDKSGCFPTQRAVIVLLYLCQCFIGYLPCGGEIGLFGGEQ